MYIAWSVYHRHQSCLPSRWSVNRLQLNDKERINENESLKFHCKDASKVKQSVHEVYAYPEGSDYAYASITTRWLVKVLFFFFFFVNNLLQATYIRNEWIEHKVEYGLIKKFSESKNSGNFFIIRVGIIFNFKYLFTSTIKSRIHIRPWSQT